MPADSASAPQTQYHELFDDPTADTTLQSTSGTLFRVPSFILRRTTGYFAATLPTPADGREIPLDSPDAPLIWVLSILCGIPPPGPLSDFAEAEEVLDLAERWSAPAPIARVRDIVANPSFPSDPLRLYALATRFGWTDEAQLAVRRTFTLSLYDPTHQPALRRLPAPSLLALLALHRRRRDVLDGILAGEGGGLAPADVSGTCPKCGLGTASSAWREYRARIFVEMDRRPLGDTVLGFAVDEWREATACWGVRCQEEGCGKEIYDRELILRRLKECIDALPDTV
ncbi:hypothetical protein FB45DRAFT_922544 [Roridomyces roridus]|uniref:BTB domain-containing protein n=1 Tax=Roridomyces roridus TaxID=1738132 RepID=A0AAD7BN15_9AGAR|nr:hypothetical protein FB45DRAFT_922544 [Roridomyces roridus]